MLEEEQKKECKSPRLIQEFSKIKRTSSPSFLARRMSMATITNNTVSPLNPVTATKKLTVSIKANQQASTGLKLQQDTSIKEKSDE